MQLIYLLTLNSPPQKVRIPEVTLNDRIYYFRTHHFFVPLRLHSQTNGMGRILSIDYGLKRVGLAVTDPLQIAANGLTTVPTSDILNFLKDYLLKEKVDKFVLGYPLQTNGKESESMKYIRQFEVILRKNFPDIELIYVDERYTSVIAHKTMLEVGLKKKDRQNKETVDKISAIIILQSYLEGLR